MVKSVFGKGGRETASSRIPIKEAWSFTASGELIGAFDDGRENGYFGIVIWG